MKIASQSPRIGFFLPLPVPPQMPQVRAAGAAQQGEPCAGTPVGTRGQRKPLLERVLHSKYGGGSVPDSPPTGPISLSFSNSVSFPSQPPRPAAPAPRGPQAPPRPQAFPAPFALPVQVPSALSGWRCCPTKRGCGMGPRPPGRGGHSPLPGSG